MDEPQTQPPTIPSVKPKGILKNAPPLQHALSINHLTWDEENLAATEIGKDSLMKITEPKTPYVRYDAETDTVEGMSDIPSFSLEPRSGTPSAPNSPVTVPPDLNRVSVDAASSSIVNAATAAALTSANTSANANMHYTSAGVPRSTSFTRSASGASSRSTSFNLQADDPTKAKIRDRSKSPAVGDTISVPTKDGEVEEDEEVDAETAEKHAAFVRARGRHYSNEAEAMKRAQTLMADEDEDEDSSAQEIAEPEEYSMEEDSSDSTSPTTGSGNANGINHP